MAAQPASPPGIPQGPARPAMRNGRRRLAARRGPARKAAGPRSPCAWRPGARPAGFSARPGSAGAAPGAAGGRGCARGSAASAPRSRRSAPPPSPCAGPPGPATPASVASGGRSPAVRTRTSPPASAVHSLEAPDGQPVVATRAEDQRVHGARRAQAGQPRARGEVVRPLQPAEARGDAVEGPAGRQQRVELGALRLRGALARLAPVGPRPPGPGSSPTWAPAPA